MKKNLFVIIMAIVSLISCSNKTEESPKAEPVDSTAIVLQNIASRKSVRHFTQEPVTQEQLQTLARAAMAAPTACNKQPWAVIAINDRTMLDSLCAGLPYAKMLAEAQAAMIVCGDLSKALEGDGAQFWIQDCSAATENLLLAAEAMRLGAVWTAVYPDPERMAIVNKVLNLPENIIPLNVIPIGHPTGEDQPKDKWIDENYHLNKW
ncbi:MAG: nitroreductase family protein [bacterium]|nr:nitroreductase family protein [Candidatus Minthenecus merdequi]